MRDQAPKNERDRPKSSNSFQILLLGIPTLVDSILVVCNHARVDDPLDTVHCQLIVSS